MKRLYLYYLFYLLFCLFIFLLVFVHTDTRFMEHKGLGGLEVGWGMGGGGGVVPSDVAIRV